MSQYISDSQSCCDKLPQIYDLTDLLQCRHPETTMLKKLPSGALADSPRRALQNIRKGSKPP